MKVVSGVGCTRSLGLEAKWIAALHGLHQCRYPPGILFPNEAVRNPFNLGAPIPGGFDCAVDRGVMCAVRPLIDGGFRH